MGLRLVVNFAYADAVRTVVSNRTVVPHLETTKDVTKIVKITVKSKMQPGETSMEGFQNRATRCCLFPLLAHRGRSFFSVRGGSHAYICLRCAIFSRFTVLREQAARYSG